MTLYILSVLQAQQLYPTFSRLSNIALHFRELILIVVALNQLSAFELNRDACTSTLAD